MKFWLIPVTAILAIAGLELFAMSRSIDGTAAALAFTAIGSIATGFTVKFWSKFRGFHISINRGNK